MSIISVIKNNILSELHSTTPLSSVEESILSVAKSKYEYDKLLKASFIKPPKLILSNFVETKHFNNFIGQSISDIDVADQAVETTASLVSKLKDGVVESFDNLYLEFNKLNSRFNAAVINANANLSNIKKDTIFFNTKEQISEHSLFVDTFESKVMLPIAKVDEIQLSGSRVTVGSSSNGYFNSSSISNIVDKDFNSYIDYRQSNSVDDLTLEINISMPILSIVNQLGILVNNFDTQNWLKLIDIRSSNDGVNFNSVFANIDFYKKYIYENTPDSDIILNPEYNNLSDLFVIDFPPTKSKYFNIIFKQSNLHPITDDFRIGIRDIFLYKITYANSGSMIIKHPLRLVDVDTIGISANVFSKIDSELLKANFQYSFDGSQWNNINTIDYQTNNIIYINSPWLKENNVINSQDNHIYIKVVFDKSIEDVEEKIKKIFSDMESTMTEYVDFPQKLPYSIQLSDIPSDNSLSMCAVPFVSLGKEPYNSVVVGTTTPGVFNYTFKLPFSLTNISELFIGNVKLTRFSTKQSLLDGDNLGYFTYDDNLFVNIKKKVIKSADFNEQWLLNDDDGAPESETIDPYLLTNGLEIKFYMQAEDINSAKRQIKLSYLSDGIKENFNINKFKLKDDGTLNILTIYDLIPMSATEINLSNRPIVPVLETDGTITNDISIEGSNRVDYIDGFTEFINHEYAYSIDFFNKKLYMRNPYLEADVTVKYYTYDSYELTIDDFEIERRDDGDYIVLDPWIFDSNSTYRIQYNIAVEIDSSYYTVNNNIINFTDEEMMNIFYGNNSLTDKQLRISYGKHENLGSSISELIETLTPILYNLSIIYSVRT